jgi:hypothetical protein
MNLTHEIRTTNYVTMNKSSMDNLIECIIVQFQLRSNK